LQRKPGRVAFPQGTRGCGEGSACKWRAALCALTLHVTCTNTCSLFEHASPYRLYSSARSGGSAWDTSQWRQSEGRCLHAVVIFPAPVGNHDHDHARPAARSNMALHVRTQVRQVGQMLRDQPSVFQTQTSMSQLQPCCLASMLPGSVPIVCSRSCNTEPRGTARACTPDASWRGGAERQQGTTRVTAMPPMPKVGRGGGQ
jgi:hypothetical protein